MGSAALGFQSPALAGRSPGNAAFPSFSSRHVRRKRGSETEKKKRKKRLAGLTRPFRAANITRCRLWTAHRSAGSGSPQGKLARTKARSYPGGEGGRSRRNPPTGCSRPEASWWRSAGMSSFLPEPAAAARAGGPASLTVAAEVLESKSSDRLSVIDWFNGTVSFLRFSGDQPPVGKQPPALFAHRKQTNQHPDRRKRSNQNTCQQNRHLNRVRRPTRNLPLAF